MWKRGHDALVIKWFLWLRCCRLAVPGASPSWQPLALAATVMGGQELGGSDTPS